MLKQLDTLIGFAVVMSVVSLLITIATQMISGFMGLRGINLVNALEVLIQKIDPDIDEVVRTKLAERILTDQAISDSMFSMRKWPILQWFSSTWLGTVWQRASAIRPDEFLESLRDLAEDKNIPNSVEPAVKEAAARLVSILSVATPATDAAIKALATALPKLAEQEGADVIAHFTAASDVALTNLQGWFNSAQDRAKQWFAMHARLITVGCALVAAFALQLDALKLLQRISSDPEIRSRLVASAPALAQQAQTVFDDASLNSYSTRSNVLASLDKEFPGLSTHITALTNAIAFPDPTNGLRQQLANTTFSNQIERICRAYQTQADAITRQKLADWSQRFGTINEQFSKTGIELLPQPYPKVFSRDWYGPPSHLLGLLASAALLSLGAPFWFNLLKSLTNLRPALAQQIEKKPQVVAPSEG